MAYTTINDSEKYFKTVLWTGNLFANGITGVNHQPDLLWFKNRNTTNGFEIRDSTRGTSRGGILLDVDNVEGDDTTRITSFDSDGFTLSTDPAVNGNQNQILAWSWKAGGGTTATISGGVNAVVQKEDTAKFAIATYTGTGSQTAFEHGLGVKPDFIVIKNRSQADSWFVWIRKAANNNQALEFGTNAALATSNGYMGNEEPGVTDPGVGLGTGSDTNASSENYIAYVWAGVQGFSKFGQYYGNGNAEGPFVYTGFKPAWVMVKKTGATHSWYTQYQGEGDTHGNPVKFSLTLDNPQVDISENSMDFLSNGFKLRTSGNGHNTNDATYAYAAFAESPFVTSNGAPGVAG